MIGQRIGNFEVTARLGAGGMGEVYRATDVSLGREVALKILPEAFVSDSQRVERFQREARILASLNHPNIAQIFGLQKLEGPMGGPSGLHCLVLELVEGEDLSERLTRGPVPVDEAVAIALQVATALEVAHEKGIIHRDFKPGNIKLTAGGQVKVLDFGLAKASEATEVADLSLSPTLTQEATQAGIILGTAGYMSPEQARGKLVDRRADIWAFGVVLFEMLTGRRTFPGEDLSDTLAAVIRAEPEWSRLPETLPKRLRTLLQRCLQKDPQMRLRDIGDARIELLDLSVDDDLTLSTPPVSKSWSRFLPWGLAGLFGIAFLATQFLPRAGQPLPVRTGRFDVNLPADSQVSMANFQYLAKGVPTMAVSPDGEKIVFCGIPGEQFQAQSATPAGTSLNPRESGGVGLGPRAESTNLDHFRLDSAGRIIEQQLFLRDFASFEVRPIPGTEGGCFPFFSPDSNWIGFFAGGKLKKVELSGGQLTTLTEAPDGMSGTWGSDNRIIFMSRPLDLVSAAGAPGSVGPSNTWGSRVYQRRLYSISSSGGQVELALEGLPNDPTASMAWPAQLPGGALLYSISSWGTENEQVVGQTQLSSPKVLVDGAFGARFIPEETGSSSGHLAYLRDGVLWVVPFDASQLELTGPAARVAEGVQQFAVSGTGTLVYVPGSASTGEFTLVWVDRQGNETPVSEIVQGYEDLHLSPDGRKIAMTIESELAQVWLYDIPRDAWTRFVVEDESRDPIWSHDGQSVTYGAKRGNTFGLFRKRFDGSGAEEALLINDQSFWVDPDDWSTDGRTLFYERPSQDPEEGGDVWVLAPGEKPRKFIGGPGDQWGVRVSPDGRWICYNSQETGQDELYVTDLPNMSRRWQISTQGGSNGIWSRDGRELFYMDKQTMMRVPLATGQEFSPGKPEPIFSGRYRRTGRDFDLAPDGSRFLMIRREAPPASSRLKVVFNWLEELKSRSAVE